MTTTIFFVRHGSHDLLGRKLCGRMAGVPLNADGEAQARRAAAWLQEAMGAEGLSALYVSPLQRAQETAAPIAAALKLEPRIEEGLNEVDFGSWTAASFDALGDDPAWRFWNDDRSQHQPPGGESMLDVQGRIARWCGQATAAHPDQRICAVCHADVIKAAVCHASGLSLDHYKRIEISPGSISTVAAGDWGLKLQSMNEVPR